MSPVYSSVLRKSSSTLVSIFAICCIVLQMSSCASVNSVSLTPIPAQRNQVVKAEVTKTIFLGFSFDNDFVDPLVSELKQKCPNGVISGILTKDETISYFIIFKKKITATGFCSGTTAKNTAGNPNRRHPTAEEETTEE